MKQKQRRAAHMREQASVDQVEQRERRRAQLPVEYTGEFDLLAEVHDILAPLADQVAAERSPLMYRPYVDKLTGAVQKVAVTAADLVASADARRAAAHLPIEQRGRAVKMLRDLAVQPVPPTITDAELASGAWASALTGHCSTYCGPLSDLLSRAAPPDTRRGAPNSCKTLVEVLRLLDHASVDAQRQLDRATFLRRELGPRSNASNSTEGVRS